MVSYTFNKSPDTQDQREKNRPIIPPATFLAILPEYRALPARFDACPNLSHLEKAKVFVIVRLKAITTTGQSKKKFYPHTQSNLTNEC